MSLPKEGGISIHFGSHPGTTARHLADAAVESGVGSPVECAPFHHICINDVRPSQYLWVESGASSFPLDAHMADCSTAGYLIDVHLDIRVRLLESALFDCVFIAQRDYLSEFQKIHPNVHWLPLAAPARLTQLRNPRRFDVAFVGTPRPDRRGLLIELNRNFGMNDWRRPHTLEELGAAYSRSRIVINPTVNSDLNMRFFEAMACGAMPVCSKIENGVDELTGENKYFAIGDLNDYSASVEMISTLLESGEPERLSEDAREWIRNGHTYHHRLEAIREAMEEAPRNAPIRHMSSRERRDHLFKLAAEAADIRLAAKVTRREAISLASARYFGLAFAKAARRRQFKLPTTKLQDSRRDSLHL